MASIFDAPESSSISKTFRGSSFYLIGSKKSGKTSTALSFHKFNESPYKNGGLYENPKNEQEAKKRGGRTLLIALESGFKAISTPFTPIICTSFYQFCQIIKELEKDAKDVLNGKKKDTEFELIVID